MKSSKSIINRFKLATDLLAGRPRQLLSCSQSLLDSHLWIEFVFAWLPDFGPEVSAQHLQVAFRWPFEFLYLLIGHEVRVVDIIVVFVVLCNLIDVFERYGQLDWARWLQSRQCLLWNGTQWTLNLLSLQADQLLRTLCYKQSDLLLHLFRSLEVAAQLELLFPLMYVIIKLLVFYD